MASSDRRRGARHRPFRMTANGALALDALVVLATDEPEQETKA